MAYLFFNFLTLVIKFPRFKDMSQFQGIFKETNDILCFFIFFSQFFTIILRSAV